MQTPDNTNSSSQAPKPGAALLVLEAKASERAGEPAAEPATQRHARGARALSFARRAAPVVGAATLALAIGWHMGEQNAALSQARAERKAFDAAFVSEMNRHAKGLAALEARISKQDGARAGIEAGEMKRALDGLSRRVDEAGKTLATQSGQASARIDRLDKEWSQRLDRLEKTAERIEKQALALTPVAAPSLGQSSAQSSAQSTAASAQPASAKGPESAARASERAGEKPLRNYVLREVFRGGALVEGRMGLMEAAPGVELPGAGRVRSVERRDGRWVVVTTAGVIDGD